MHYGSMKKKIIAPAATATTEQFISFYLLEQKVLHIFHNSFSFE